MNEPRSPTAGLTRTAVFCLLALIASCDQKEKSTDETEASSGKMLTGPMKGVYKYTDKHGVINYVDSIEKVPLEYRKKAVHPTGGSVSIIPSTPIDDLLDKHGLDYKAFTKKHREKKPERHGQVIIYSTSWCPACRHAKAYLRKKGVDFIVKDVEKNKDNMKEMLRKSGGARGVPVIDVRGKILRGFNSRALDKALSG